MAAWAAPGNDHCWKATIIKDPREWCSQTGAYNNLGATASGLDAPACFPPFLKQVDADQDVWFKFTAVATSVNISVIGAVEKKPGGTLQGPQFALYKGSCDAGLVPIACISDAQGYNIAETYAANLVVGGIYYIRVDGRKNKSGTFQLCLRNFNPVASPTSDCSRAVVLCDKSSFTVPSVLTAGREQNELPAGICLPEESQSVWYKWTCDKPGTLAFTLRPVNPSDDLDFVVFALPDGLDACSRKIPLRCVAAGENVGEPFFTWVRCSGPTGLRTGEGDLSEDQGCDDSNNNFAAPLLMEAGMSYALVVNNYHNTGNGFSIEFSGTGTFAGPKAHFTLSKLKLGKGERLTIKNASSFPGGIRNWVWNFGVDASPQTASGAGPHEVTYSSPGKKSISLRVETANGCQVTKVRTLEVLTAPAPPALSADTASLPTEPVLGIDSQSQASRSVVAEPKVILDSTATPTAVKAAFATPSAIAVEPSASPNQSSEAVQASPQPDSSGTASTGRKPEVLQMEVEYLVEHQAILYFKADSFQLEEKDLEVMEKVLELMRANPEYKAYIEGHTNNVPSDEYCLKLGTLRANGVRDWLLQRGIPMERMIIKVFGKDKVVTKDIARKSRRLNQRVEVKIIRRQN
jgi:outer membrane protein OmpA-like peptidoglycan-associated protein